jgi:type IV pilus assembly protein PilN
MIRINLLPVKAAQKKEQLRKQLVVSILTLILVVTGCFAVHTSLNSDVEKIKDEIARNDREINSLKKKIGEVDKYKKLQEELKNKLDVLEALKAAKSGPVHLMDELIESLPEKLWITDFKETGGSVSLKGFGLSEDDVATFMTNLEESAYYKNIVLKVMKQVEQGGFKWQNFELTSQTEKRQAVPAVND